MMITERRYEGLNIVATQMVMAAAEMEPRLFDLDMQLLSDAVRNMKIKKKEVRKKKKKKKEKYRMCE